MPRKKIITAVSEYKGYEINDRYEYDKNQLDWIIRSLEYYQGLSINNDDSDYVVFDITINIEETSKSPFFNISDFDDGANYPIYFNPNQLKTILPSEYYFYRWTREFKEDYAMGEHYHLMVIANHFPITKLDELRREVENLEGVKTAFISPRKLEDDDHRRIVHFHWLNREIDSIDGLYDSIKRHCYRAKLNQKLPFMPRSFDGCRHFRPLLPVSEVNYLRRIRSLDLAPF